MNKQTKSPKNPKSWVKDPYWRLPRFPSGPVDVSSVYYFGKSEHSIKVSHKR